jgi:hypothetical protein
MIDSYHFLSVVSRGTMIDYTLDQLFIHLDDPDPKIQVIPPLLPSPPPTDPYSDILTVTVL